MIVPLVQPFYFCAAWQLQISFHRQ
jgi:hypothetical protein